MREQIPLEGFDKDQERKLKSKKRSLVYQSEEDKWKGVYRILFPDDSEADMPSPCKCFTTHFVLRMMSLTIPDIEYHPCNVGQSAEPSNVARFQEFSRLELPRLVRRTLEVAVEEEAQPLEHKLKERLVDIVRECQTQLISMFQTTANPGVEASELAPVLEPPSTVSAQLAAPAAQITETPFGGFDSYAVTSTDFIPIPAAQYNDCELQPYEQTKPEASPPADVASDSPDSGYDSTWPAASGFHPDTTNFVQEVPQPVFTAQPTTAFQQPYHAPQPPPVAYHENEYVDLGGYYGLFENRNQDMLVGGTGIADASWAYSDPTAGGSANAMMHQQQPGMGAGAGLGF